MSSSLRASLDRLYLADFEEPGALFLHLLDAAPDALVTSDQTGTIAFVNKQVQQLFGYTRAELIGQTIDLLLPERFHRQHVGHWAHFVSAPRTRPMGAGLDLWGRHQDGREFPIEVSLSYFSTTDGLLVTSAIRDISERNRLEQSLRASDATHRFLSEVGRAMSASLVQPTSLEQIARLSVPFMGDCCIIELVDAERNVQPVAVAHVDPLREASLRDYRRRFPLSLTDSENPLVGDLFRGQPRVFDLSKAHFALMGLAGERLEAARAQGFTNAIYVPMVVRDRQVGAISFFLVTTDRTYGSADLDVATRIGRIVAQAIDNAQLYRQAQDAIHLRDTVLASVTHDLRSPLTAIRLIAETTRMRTAKQVTLPEIGERLKQIEYHTSRMADQIDELLDVARLQGGEPLQLRRRPTDLVPLVRTRAEAQQQRTARHHLRFETELPALVGRWDTQRIERVVDNLLSNAVKYSLDGGDVSVSLSSELLGGITWAVLRVADHGAGIPERDLPRVFTWFYRGDNVADKVSGAGIGLAGARQIVEQHGGTIQVESQECVGSTFTVRLPVSSPT